MAEATSFTTKTYEMMNVGYEEIGWSDDGKIIVIHNPERLASKILPEHFGHAQYASWVRAANAHGFKKAGRASWSHPEFRRDRPDLLPKIQRKKAKPKPKPEELAPDEPDSPPSWSLAELELTFILDEERDGLEFLREELRRLEKEAADLERENAAESELKDFAMFLAQEVHAMKPLEGPTANEFAAKYNCPLQLPGLRMLGADVQGGCTKGQFECSHELLARYPHARELADKPEFAKQISEIRAQYEQFCKAYPEGKICEGLEKHLHTPSHTPSPTQVEPP